MQAEEVTGIIDIGSNTVRLAVYRLSGNGAYRIIDQGRWPARLSKRLTADGRLPDEAVDDLTEVLLHYRRICLMHGASKIRAVATAAIRAAANGESIVRRLAEATGFEIEVLPGQEEARLGSEAMLRTLNLPDGFVVDIGGGSTEVSLLLNRQIVSAVSFPIGCVNAAERYNLGEATVSDPKLKEMVQDVQGIFGMEPWIAKHPGLPLVGLGGTVRAFAKLRQQETEYPFPQLHGYEQSEKDLASSLDKLASLPIGKRRKLPGLSKDRADVIIPGMAILHALMRETDASRLVVCGAGLRDGLFFETFIPRSKSSAGDQVLQDSVRNLNALYPTAPVEHLEQVRRLALAIFDRIAAENEALHGSPRIWLATAAGLFRIGAAIDLNDSADHTFYMLVHTHWNGLPHREILLTAAIASFRGMNALRRKLSPYRSILHEGDIDTAAKLGSLLQLAAALDRSESQAIRSLEVEMTGGKLKLTAHAEHSLAVERMELDPVSKDFSKIWHLRPSLTVVP